MKSCQQKAMETLLHGHGYANQLKRIMDHSDQSDSSMEREDLANSVLHCFSDALSILIDTSHHEDDESNNSSPQDSSPVLEKPLHKRGRYRSISLEAESNNDIYVLISHHHDGCRKTSMAESSEYRRHESPIPIYHDGFLWRKYGQKQIKESHHQRYVFISIGHIHI